MSEATKVLLTIRWRDLDPLGHVNNAVFLTYLEEARDQWLRQLQSTIGPQTVLVARIVIDFRRQVRHADQELLASCRLAEIGESSITTREELRLRDNSLVAEGSTVLVAFDPATGGSRSLTEAEREALSGQPRGASLESGPGLPGPAL